MSSVLNNVENKKARSILELGFCHGVVSRLLLTGLLVTGTYGGSDP